ncbi:MAG: pyruvate dehydrogenase complex E1 component subunit beta, partial [Verrucomicrobiota bacterium]
MPAITYRQALNDAFAEEIERDENVVLLGEEVAQYNGAYKVTEGLWAKYGDERVVDTPISEAGFIGMGIGASMLGVRPVIELMFYSFAFVAWDQMINNAAAVRYMSGGQINCPIVIRGPANGGTNVGATHSHTPENMAANHPGLKVVYPATAYDAKGMMKTAIRDNDPVFFMESTTLYGMEWEVPEEEYLIPLGKADVKKEGTDITLICHGGAVITCLEAAKILEEEYEIEAEVLDLRSIRPLDEQAIIESVKKTNRAVLVEEMNAKNRGWSTRVPRGSHSSKKRS